LLFLPEGLWLALVLTP
jgi:hypothetical protein